jgi:DNA-binding MarR family transcriptional regulator
MPESTSRPLNPALAASWSRLMVLFTAKRDNFLRLMREQRLTPPHGIALAQLVEGPLRMRDLADAMQCDASYITDIVDRLEQEGLAQRQPSTADRRVKEIALTEKGKQVGAQLNRAFAEPPPQLAQLSNDDQAELARLLSKIVTDDQVAEGPLRLSRRS